MKLKQFEMIVLSLSVIIIFSHCGKKDKITAPETTITESENLKTATHRIGPNGGTIDFGDGTVLMIPFNALSNEVDISMSKILNAPPFSMYGSETIILEPSGISFKKPFVLQMKYEEFQDFDDELISIMTYNQGLDRWERLKILEKDQTQKLISVEVEHFSLYKCLFDPPLELVLEIPGEYLQKGDILFTLTDNFTWNPGHTGLFLGTKDASSWQNDGETTIESSPWPNKPYGVQFNTLTNFILGETGLYKHLYMGARRYRSDIITNADQTNIAYFAISKLNNAYYDVTDWWGMNTLWGKGQYNFPGESSCYCSGLVEGAYDNANKSIVEGYLEWPGVMPVEQFIRTVPVEEITIKTDNQLSIPVKGVVWNLTNKIYSDDASLSKVEIYDKPLGSTFNNNIFSWHPSQLDVDKIQTLYFTVSSTVGSKSYLRSQQLKINIEKSSNTAPIASFNIEPNSGNLNTNFKFDASGCSDGEDAQSALQVRWDWDNDGWDTDYSTVKIATHRYNLSGTKIIKLEVKDSGGLSDQIIKTLTITDENSGETNIVLDIDRNIYKTIKIGNQIWMAENLKVTHYRNGDVIPNISSNNTWATLSNGAYCNYNNEVNYVTTYGRMYNWYVINDSRNIAPTGWHIPSNEEWQTLANYLGGNSIAGGKLKEVGYIHWQSPNSNANNESGFNGLPSGSRITNGNFFNLGTSTYFWSSTNENSTHAWNWSLEYNNGIFHSSYNDMHNGFSIRCIKD